MLLVKQTDNYRPDIDGLRAIAVLSVIVYHLFPGLFPSGFIGVDIFFVISGYLITGIIIKELDSGHFTVKDFYIRRVRRILPALLTVLAATFLLAWFLLLPTEFVELGKHFIGASSFTSNLLLWSESGYFDLASEKKPLLHLWSLGVEEQFYIFWPLILMSVAKFKTGFRHLPLVTTTLSLIACITVTQSDITAAFYSPLTRFWELGFGALLAQQLNNSNSLKLLNSKSALIMSTLGFGLLFFSFFQIDKSTLFPGYWAIGPTLAATLIIAAGGRSILNRVLLGNKLMVGFGLISYPLYLWHWPILSIAQIIENGLHRDGRVGIMIFSILLAIATYRFIERPIRRGKSSSRIIGVLLAGLLMTGLVGGVVIYKDGFESRIDANLAALSRDFKGAVTLPRPTGDWCESRKASFCSYTGLEPNVALIGDSHARSISYGLKEYLTKKGDTLLTIGTGGCHLHIPTLTREMDKKYGVCEDELFDTLDGVIEDNKIHTVFLTSYTTGKITEAEIERQKIGLDRVTSRLMDAGKRVIYLMDVPDLEIEPRFCLPSSKQTDQEGIDACTSSRARFDERSKVIHSAISELLKSKNIPYVVLSSPLCDEKYCYGRNKEMLFYVDDDHLSIRGAEFVINQLTREIDSIYLKNDSQ